MMKSQKQKLIEGYINYRQDRGGNRKGGGTSTYVSTTLSVTSHESHSNGVCDTVYVEIEEMNLGIINIYRPPSSDIHSFEDILSQVREWTEQTTKELVLIGDLNFPDQHSWSEADREGIRESIQGRQRTQWGRELTQAVILLEFIEENCLSQWVQEET